jgi:serine/threonine-protein kinase
MGEARAGERVDQYQLTELLARSGMASIWRAVDTETGATVALKIPHPQYEGDVVFSQRFQREEEVGQRLDHPHIVKVLRPQKKSQPYLAMEFVEGRSLRALMQEQRPFPTEQALDLAGQVCDALAYMHGQGIVHRDIKPENILVDASGRAKILDFGIALDESARRLTWTGLSNTIGTPDYMAPEQIGGRRGDERTDVYAVGTLLYELLTGELPWSAANPNALLRSKANEEPRPPSYHLPTIDPNLETIILRAIARAPRDRYPNAQAMLADLRNPAAVQPLERPPAARPRVARRLAMPLLVLVILAGLAALVVLASRR